MVSLPFSTWGFGEITGTSDSSILWREREGFFFFRGGGGALMHFLNGRVLVVPSHPLFSNVACKQLSHSLSGRHRTTRNNKAPRIPKLGSARCERCPQMYTHGGFIYSRVCLTCGVPAGSLQVKSNNVLELTQKGPEWVSQLSSGNSLCIVVDYEGHEVDRSSSVCRTRARVPSKFKIGRYKWN